MYVSTNQYFQTRAIKKNVEINLYIFVTYEKKAFHPEGKFQ